MTPSAILALIAKSVQVMRIMRILTILLLVVSTVVRCLLGVLLLLVGKGGGVSAFMRGLVLVNFIIYLVVWASGRDY